MQTSSCSILSHHIRTEKIKGLPAGVGFGWIDKRTPSLWTTNWEADLNHFTTELTAPPCDITIGSNLVVANENHTWWWNRGPEATERLGQTVVKNRECIGWNMFSDPQRLANRLCPSISGDKIAQRPGKRINNTLQADRKAWPWMGIIFSFNTLKIISSKAKFLSRDTKNTNCWTYFCRRCL